MRDKNLVEHLNNTDFQYIQRTIGRRVGGLQRSTYLLLCTDKYKQFGFFSNIPKLLCAPLYGMLNEYVKSQKQKTQTRKY